MTLSRPKQCPCKNQDGGLFLCPNCGREYPHTTLPDLLLNASLAAAQFSLEHVLIWWSHFLEGCSAFAGVHAKSPLGSRTPATGQRRKDSFPHLR
jgi:hypothetical protein